MQQTLYIELKGQDAVETLRPLLWQLAAMPGFLGGELLISPAQPGLALLQSRWDRETPEIKLEGARSWTFLVVEQAGASGAR